MSDSDLVFLPVVELVSLVRHRQLSPVEVVSAYLQRIEQLDKTLHAYITVCGDGALEAAKRAEQALTRGDAAGPLHGIPFGVKDQIDAGGVVTTRGFSSVEAPVAREDATVVGRLQAAGAILLGKHNLTGFAAGGPSGFPFGRPRNPWSPEHHPGGSSNGSAIAVAAGLAAAAIGEDTGGSIRVPASHNGVVGLRPSWGRVSLHGVRPIVHSMDTVGPIARCVRDCALLLGIIAGRDPRDPWTADLPVPDFLAQLGGSIRGVRVGAVAEFLHDPALDPEVAHAAQEAIRVLEGVGVKLVEVSLPLMDAARAASIVINDAEMAGRYRRSLDDRPQAHSAEFRQRLNASDLLPAALRYKVEQARAMVRQQVLEAFNRIDILLSPCLPTPPPRVDQAGPRLSGTGDAQRVLFEGYPYTSIYSLAGVPAVSVPCGFTQDGLPIGLQLAGRPFDEAAVLRVAYAYEQLTPWHRRHP